MKTNILAPGIMAVAIHVLILSAPLSKTRHNWTPAHVHEPISLCVIRSQETGDSVPYVKASRQAPEMPLRKAASHVPGRQTAMLKRKASSDKHFAAKEVSSEQTITDDLQQPELVARSDNEKGLVEEGSPEEMRKVREKTIDGEHFARTASINGHVPEDGQRHVGAAHRTQNGKGNIVYARPKYKENPLPHYPKVARRRGYEGRTLLMVEVLENGTAGEIEIKESSGFKVLDTAALRSVRGWTFVPGTINGKRTEQWIRVPIRFVLK